MAYLGQIGRKTGRLQGASQLGRLGPAGFSGNGPHLVPIGFPLQQFDLFAFFNHMKNGVAAAGCRVQLDKGIGHLQSGSGIRRL